MYKSEVIDRMETGSDSRLFRDDIQELVRGKVAELRRRLIDFSRRNPLINLKLQANSTSHIRIVDELPEVLRLKLVRRDVMTLKALPSLEDELPDEQSDEFVRTFDVSRLADSEYLDEIQKIENEDDKSEQKLLFAERALKDRIRLELSLPPRQTKDSLSLARHAENHGINSTYSLPYPDEKNSDGRHDDAEVQTLLLPDRLSRLGKSIMDRGRSFERETGVNVLQVAFGLLEWKPVGEASPYVSPLLLMEIEVRRRQTSKGPQFDLVGSSRIVPNTSLELKLSNDHNVELPEYAESSLEEYFEVISQVAPDGLDWKVRREVVVGVFPSSKIAMYRDLDPEENDIAKHPIIAKLLASSGEAEGVYSDVYDTDSPEIERKVPHLIDRADASQYSALVDVADGKSIAIEGPPGSGKSQTIVNIIASALADGKKVLFVAEKLTALDVVKARLQAAGLGAFLMPLQAGRGASDRVYESIAERIGYSKKDLQSETDFETQRGLLHRRRRILQSYLDTLGLNFGATGLTVYQILGHAIQTASDLDGLPRQIRRLEPTDLSQLTPSDRETLFGDAERLANRLDRISNMPQLWSLASSPATRLDDAEDSAQEAKEIYEALKKINVLVDTSQFSQLLKGDRSAEVVDTYVRFLEMATGIGKDLDLKTLEALKKKADQDTVKEALSIMTAVTEHTQNLSAAGINFGSLVEQRLLDEALSFSKAHDSQISPSSLEMDCASSMSTIRSLEGIIEAVEDLPPAWRRDKIELRTITKLCQRVMSFPSEILSLRISGEAKATARAVQELTAQKDMLIGRFEILKKRLKNIEGNEDSTQLRLSGEVFQSSAMKRLFSSDFKTANRLYVETLGGNAGLKPRQMAQDLFEYSEWLEAHAKFQEDSNFKNIFGDLFTGLLTNVTLLDRLKEFFLATAEIAGDDDALKTWLEMGRLTSVENYLSAINDAREYALEGLDNCEAGNLRQSLEQQNVVLQTQLDEVEEAKTHLSIFVDRIAVDEEEIAELSERHASLIMLKGQLENHSAKELIDSAWIGENGQPDLVRQHLELSEALNSHLEPSAIQSMFEDIGASSAFFEQLRSELSKVAEKLASFSENLGLPEEWRDVHFAWGNLEVLKDASEKPTLLMDRALLKRNESDLEARGFGPLLTWLASHPGPVNERRLSKLVRALTYRSMANAVLSEHKTALQDYDGQEFGVIRAEIAKRDNELNDLSRRVVASKLFLEADVPSGNNIGPKSSFTDLALIRNELYKKKRRIGVRQLTNRAQNALLELKPCWMMSPLAIAQYLKKETEFDLIVIDEASQMTPENAIGALSKGRQAIVVGDTKQLPPTSFFKKDLDDEDVDEDLQEHSESILDLANIALSPVRQLRWHYRSEHSSLIQFSNHWMYKDELTIFPSANEEDPTLGVSLIEVEGCYVGKRNEIEAQRLIEEVVKHMEQSPELSLGVCTMNTEQRDLLLQEFERERDRNPKVQDYVLMWENTRDSLEEFFIKNLETIQGDERDVMFVSTLYGPTERGVKPMQRFGPINTLNGHRRLNVLFTRAKKRIVTFSSLKPADILRGEGRPIGVNMFAAWLEYSKTGKLLAGHASNREMDSPFEEHVARCIEGLGLQVDPQVGVSGYRVDLGLRHPDWPYGYLLGIECDGAAYHSSKSSRDRDRLRQEVLEARGWELYRIWSTDWFRDPEKELKKLQSAISSTLEKQKGKLQKTDLSSKAEKVSEKGSLEKKTEETSPPEQAEYVRSKARQAEMFVGSLFEIEDGSKETQLVTIGSTVEVVLQPEGKKLKLKLVRGGSEIENGKVGISSALGKELVDREVGEKFEYLNGVYVKNAEILSLC